MATPWEVALEVTQPKIYPHKPPAPSHQSISKVTYDKLSAIAHSPRHSTRAMAACLQRMLAAHHGLTEDAMKRVERMLGLNHTFFEHHYARYAFCVSVIVHEISLALILRTNADMIKDEYRQFMEESYTTLMGALQLKTEDISAMQFVAAPALSGTHAYAMALYLSQSISSYLPKVGVAPPFYYEHEKITSNMTSSLDDAHMIVTSAGPIVYSDGHVSPGVDINRLIKRHVKAKPLTIIMDASTALYKNLSLTAESVAMIRSGRLSLLMYESRQKFGLIHTDQAQYGRLFGLCSREQYPEMLLEAFARDVEDDFLRHPDLRIGAFISTTCHDWLEIIKRNHFVNGALLRNALLENELVDQKIMKHELMQTDMNELYFSTTASHASLPGIEKRHSFGHFSTTVSEMDHSYRISANASDPIDTLIHTALLYLTYPRSWILFEWIMQQEFVRVAGPMSLEDQIFILASQNAMIWYSCSLTAIKKDNPTELFVIMTHLLSQCSLLKSRPSYILVEQFLIKCRAEVTKQFAPAHKGHFFATLQVLHALSYKLTSPLAAALSEHPEVCKTIHDLALKNPRKALGTAWKMAIENALRVISPQSFENILFQATSSACLKDQVISHHQDRLDFSLNTLTARPWSDIKEILAAIPAEVKQLDCRWNGFAAVSPEGLLELTAVVPHTVTHIAWMDDFQMSGYLRKLLEEGEQAHALLLFLKHDGDLTIFDMDQNQTLLARAENNNNYGVFTNYFNRESDACLIQFIKAKNEFQALSKIQSRGLNANHSLFGKSLMEWLKFYHLESLQRVLVQEYVMTLLASSEEEARAYFMTEQAIFPDEGEFDKLVKEYRLRVLLARNTEGDTILHRQAPDDAQFVPILKTLQADFSLELSSILNEEDAKGRSILYLAASNPKSLAAVLAAYQNEFDRTLAVREAMAIAPNGESLLHVAVIEPECLEILKTYYRFQYRDTFYKNSLGVRPIDMALLRPKSLRMLLTTPPYFRLLEDLCEETDDGESIIKRALAYPESLKVIFAIGYALRERLDLQMIRREDSQGNTLLHHAVSHPAAWLVIMAQYEGDLHAINMDLAMCNQAGVSVQSLVEALTDSGDHPALAVQRTLKQKLMNFVRRKRVECNVSRKLT